MKLQVRKTSAAVAAVATAGASSVLLGAAPAAALPTEPCLDGYLVEPGICEIAYTGGSNTFLPTAEMTQLEVLLVGGGGSGVALEEMNNNGYAAAGGGGEVTYVDATGATTPIELAVGGPGLASIYDAEGQLVFAAGGSDGVVGGSASMGGASGNLNDGASEGVAGGGGAAGATADANGGAGVTVADIVPDGSLFENDLSCYGGGGAAGSSTTFGTPGCGGGGPTDATGTALLPPTANSGGGGGGVHTAQAAGAADGASGVIKVRWNAAPVTITFDVAGKGTAPAPQKIIPGFTAAQPAAPTASGWDFTGWYADAALTIPVDFSAPVTESSTYYAAWSPALAATGSGQELTALPIALGALVAGAGVLVATQRRRRA